jgi:hypothetical protein
MWTNVAAVAVFLLVISPFVLKLRRMSCPQESARRVVPPDGVPLGTPPLDGCVSPELPARYSELKVRLAQVEELGPDYYREAFKDGPVGPWSGWREDAMLMAQWWEFRTDGTGDTVYTGIFGRAEDKYLFEWRPAGDLTIEILQTGHQTCMADDNSTYLGDWRDAYEGMDLEAERSSPDDEWETIRYDFLRVEDGYGPTIVMTTAGQDGFKTCFSYKETPLAFNGRSIPPGS